MDIWPNFHACHFHAIKFARFILDNYIVVYSNTVHENVSLVNCVL